jgi:peptidoglycan hydrolase-like protein with peptidoglycan-binding domain
MKIVNAYLIKGSTDRPLKVIKAIVIHWVANPNTSAIRNRNYWENLGSGVSAHEIIDLDGTVVLCVKSSIMCYHVGSPKGYTKEALKRLGTYPNNCTYGIETTHIDWAGRMTPATYNALVERTAQRVKEFNLTANDVWTHHEIVGAYKDCHRWFTANPTEWAAFKKRVAGRIDGEVLAPVTKPVQIAKPAVKPAAKPVVKVYDPMADGILEKGEKGEDIKLLQTKLNRAGYTVGAVDGIYGVKTEAEVKRLQRDYKLIQDGKFGVKTEAALTKALLPKHILPTGVLRLGDVGEEVRKLQDCLNAVYFKCGAEDGHFGAATKNALTRFQKVYTAYHVDGIYGSRTKAALAAVLRKG